MRRIRVIPTLLLDGKGRMVKSVRFGKRTYIGDPINAVKIFNEKEVDELVLLDIDATKDRRLPNFPLIEEIVAEAFMPIGYGGGISSDSDVEKLFNCGLEKIVLCSAALSGSRLIESTAKRYGSQSVCVCLNTKRTWGRTCLVNSSTVRCTSFGSPALAAKFMQDAGAGEILLYSVDKDGTMRGYDLETIESVVKHVQIPIIACGGAASISHMFEAIDRGGASAVAAGSMFVYHGGNRGVLISYPSQARLKEELFSKL